MLVNGDFHFNCLTAFGLPIQKTAQEHIGDVQILHHGTSDLIYQVFTPTPINNDLNQHEYIE